MKKKRIKSAIPIYLAAAVWLLTGLIKPSMMLHVSMLALTTALSAGAYAVGSKLFPGKVVEVRECADTGDAELNRQIEEGRRQLDNLRAHNDQLPDPVISEKLDRMVSAGNAILNALEEKPARLSEVRRFMNYFLPTAEKLVASYVVFEQAPVKGENVCAAMKSVEDSLSMVADAFEKQYDSLYRNESYNVEAEVKVMETLLKGQGLTAAADFGSEKAEEKTKPTLTL